MSTSARVAALIVLVVAATPAIARAQDTCAPPPGSNPHADPALKPPADDAAVKLMKDGNANHRVGDYKEAIDAYKAGAKIESAPIFFYSLGQSYRLSGQYKEAILQYNLFLARAKPGKPLRDLVECQVRMMTAELQRAAMTEPPIDPPPSEVPTRSASPGAEPVAEVEADEPVPAAPAPWYADGVGWGVAGGGVVASGIGALLLFSSSDLRDQAQTEDREAVRTDLLSKADTRQTWGAVGVVVGGAALVAGVVKLVITPDPPRDELGVSLEVGPRYVGLVARF